MNKKFTIEAESSFWNLDLIELFHYKDLFITLAWRDFKVRYAQTFVGLLWAFIQPLFTIAIQYLLFVKFLNVNGNRDAALVSISIGTCAWTFFSYVVTNSGNSIISSQQMVKKIYFPRLALPISKAFVGLIDLGLALLILLVLMIIFRVVPTHNIIFFPLFIIIDVIASLGVGIWLSALTIRYRDFQYVVPFLIQIGFYLTPIGYPVETVLSKMPNWAVHIYYLNPLVGIIQGLRWSVFGGSPPNMHAYISIGIVLLIFITSIYYFKSVERKIADIV
jgi:lipopolysaccharide transport system permease protein